MEEAFVLGLDIDNVASPPPLRRMISLGLLYSLVLHRHQFRTLGRPSFSVLKFPIGVSFSLW